MVSAEEVERHLAVGHTVIMVTDPPRDDGYRERVHIRGWQRGKYLLLDAEMSRTAQSIFRPDTQCVLRFVSEGFACVGHSVVQDLGTGSHFSYVRVKWPTAFTSVPVRRYERVRVHVPCEIAEGDRVVQGELTDMSIGGCRILADAPIPVDADCRLTCTLPDGAQINGVSIAVCNCVRAGTRHSIGCTFSDRDELAWNDIEFYVATTLTRLRGEAPDAASVLILDAQPRTIQPTRTMLEREGYNVAVTQAALDAFFMLRMHAPDILLVNQDVPDMDVATLCSTLRASRRFESLPIVVYGAGPANAALDAGANEHIPQLTPTPELCALIQRHTERQETQEAAAG